MKPITDKDRLDYLIRMQKHDPELLRSNDGFWRVCLGEGTDYDLKRKGLRPAIDASIRKTAMKKAKP